MTAAKVVLGISTTGLAAPSGLGSRRIVRQALIDVLGLDVHVEGRRRGRAEFSGAAGRPSQGVRDGRCGGTTPARQADGRSEPRAGRCIRVPPATWWTHTSGSHLSCPGDPQSRVPGATEGARSEVLSSGRAQTGSAQAAGEGARAAGRGARGRRPGRAGGGRGDESGRGRGGAAYGQRGLGPTTALAGAGASIGTPGGVSEPPPGGRPAPPETRTTRRASNSDDDGISSNSAKSVSPSSSVFSARP